MCLCDYQTEKITENDTEIKKKFADLSGFFTDFKIELLIFFSDLKLRS